MQRFLAAVLAILASTATLYAQSPGQLTQGPGNTAGLLYASNFGQWKIQGNSSFSWSGPTGCAVTADGMTLNPVFKVGTPVQIVDANPALNEVVTPTAVNVSGSGCSISVTPAHQHYSFYITSATAGLQESINWAAGLPYSIIITPDWSRLGGVTSTITSAQGNTNAWILDERVTGLACYSWDGSAYVNSNCASGGGSGTVTSVGLTMPSIFTVTGSPITASGTFGVTLANENANTVFAGPASGSAAAPTFRSLASEDIPDLSGIYCALTGCTMTGALTTTDLSITGCGAGTYAKADGTGCGTPGGSGTVNAGTLDQLGYYASSGTTISGLTMGTGCSISGGVMNCQGGIIPSNANFVFGPTSINVDDLQVLGVPITATSYSCNGTACTANFSAGSYANLALGNWISVRYLTNWPAAPTGYSGGTGYTLFQIASETSTSITWNYSLNSPSCASSCGTFESAMGFYPFLVTSSAALPSAASANTIVVLPTATPTLQEMAANYSTLYHPYSPAVTGHPAYLIINNWNNDSGVCRTAAQVETDLQTIFSAAHTDGYKVVVGNGTAINYNQQTAGCTPFIYSSWYPVYYWLLSQGPTPANIANGNKYWDKIIDTFAAADDANNSALVASNGGFGPKGAWSAAQATVNALVTDAPITIGTQRALYGDIGENKPSGYSGAIYVPSAVAQNMWQWCDSPTCTHRLARLSYYGSVGDLDLGNSDGTAYMSERVYGYPGNNGSSPIANFIDLNTGSSPAAISEVQINRYIPTPTTPYGVNATQMVFNSDAWTSGQVNPTSGHAVDLGWDFNDASTTSKNDFYIHVWGDSYDSLHAANNGQVCVGTNSIFGGSPQAGCPTTATFSVGTTGQWQVASTGYPTLTGCATGTYLKADGTGCATPANNALWTPTFGTLQSPIPTPANDIPYYIGMPGMSENVTNISSGYWFPQAPVACTATYVRYYTQIQGTKDSTANPVSLEMYDVTTATPFADSAATVSLNGSSYPTIAPIYGLSDAVAQGDVIVLMATMPHTWGTQPTNVAFGAQFSCKVSY